MMLKTPPLASIFLGSLLTAMMVAGSLGSGSSTGMLRSAFRRARDVAKPLYVMYTRTTLTDTLRRTTRITCAAECARKEVGSCGRCVDFQFDADSQECTLTLSSVADVINESPSVTYSRKDSPVRDSICPAPVTSDVTTCANRWVTPDGATSRYYVATDPKSRGDAGVFCGGMGASPILTVEDLLQTSVYLVRVETETELGVLGEMLGACPDLAGIEYFWTGAMGVISWSITGPSIAVTLWESKELTHAGATMSKTHGYKLVSRPHELLAFPGSPTIGTPYAFICEA